MKRDSEQTQRLLPGDATSFRGQIDFAEFLPEYKYQSAIRRLSRGITHDYNNIFAGISGQFSMHSRDGQSFGANSDRRRMIEDLLQRGVDRTSMFFEFCRLKKEPPKLLQPVRIAEKAVDLLNGVSRLHHFDFKLDLQTLPKIYGCYRDLLLMLFYLGENSIDAAPEGGIVRLQADLQHGPGDTPNIVFEVADDGNGFTEEILGAPTIASIVQTNSEGVVSGAGLFTVARIVEEHGGRLMVANRKSGGALVQVVIPAAEIQYSELEQLEWDLDDTIGVLEPRLEEKFIFLIIDDEESIRSILLDQFQRRGHVAFCVASCEEAIQDFEELSDIITAVLLDVGLRDCSGYECLERLLQINKDVPVIMMSGEEFTIKDKTSNTLSYLKKPFTVEMVERLCRQ